MTNTSPTCERCSYTDDEPFKVHPDRWFFPQELRVGLVSFDMPVHTIDEALACAWEYSRSVIPTWTNWPRYLAFNRTIIIAVTGEFRGDLIPSDL